MEVTHRIILIFFMWRVSI